MTPVVALNGLTKLYRRSRGVQSIHIEIMPGESVAIVGHNGAGKSTLLKLLTGWLIPESGTGYIEGIELTCRRKTAPKIGFVPEEPHLYEHFSVAYNLRLFAKLLDAPLARVDDLIRQFQLSSFALRKVRQLSKGTKQRVSLARAMLADPAVLILDEPSSGLDFNLTKALYHDLQDLQAAGKTILFSSHRSEEIRLLAKRVIALRDGSIVFDGSTQAYFDSRVHHELFVQL